MLTNGPPNSPYFATENPQNKASGTGSFGTRLGGCLRIERRRYPIDFRAPPFLRSTDIVRRVISEELRKSFLSFRLSASGSRNPLHFPHNSHRVTTRIFNVSSSETPHSIRPRTRLGIFEASSIPSGNSSPPFLGMPAACHPSYCGRVGQRAAGRMRGYQWRCGCLKRVIESLVGYMRDIHHHPQVVISHHLPPKIEETLWIGGRLGVSAPGVWAVCVKVRERTPNSK
jgi:hypothetical protein